MSHRFTTSRWLLLDLAERVVCIVVFAYFVGNIVESLAQRVELTSIMILVSVSTITIFVLIRRPAKDISRHPGDWALAFIASILPMLVVPVAGRSLLPEMVVVGLMLAGGAIEVSAKLVLRRSFGVVAANRGVKVGGPYRVVRHPIYAGYILTEIGFLLANPTARNFAIYGLAWMAQLARILAEERILLADEAYRRFAARVRYRLVPRVF